ncbi:MAG: rhomboid family intramembrane serine protease [Planctomycetota bacterium]
MFPFRDHNPTQNRPYVTWLLIAINVLVFALQTSKFGLGGEALGQFFETWGAKPASFLAGGDWKTLVTCMFLHSGVMHVGGNMMFLYIFGDNLEDILGHFGFLAFYLVVGIGASYSHAWSEPQSLVPLVGASGAVAGVMGGYLLYFPLARVDILLILGLYTRIFTVPAFVMLGAWFGLEFFQALKHQGAGVAHWAHTGGLAIGLVSMVPLWFWHGGPKLWRKIQGKPPHAPTHPPVVMGRTARPLGRPDRWSLPPARSQDRFGL